MEKIDELSRIIGQLEGKVGSVENKMTSLCTKVDTLNTVLTNYRIKLASIAGAISLIISLGVAIAATLIGE